MQFEHVVCPFCPVLCDDLTVEVRDGAIVGVTGCPAGRELFLSAAAESAQPQEEGQTTILDEALWRAGVLLAGSLRPLFLLMGHATSEAATAAVALARQVSGIVDGPPEMAGTVDALALSGLASASLGEACNRADLIVCWRTDVAAAQPCLWRRTVEAPGLYRPNGRADRTVVAVGGETGGTAASADLSVPVAPGGAVDLLWALRGQVAGRGAPAGTGGPAADLIGDLARRMRAARYGVLFYDAGASSLEQVGLLALADELNAVSRWAAFGLPSGPNAWGTTLALAAATGFGRAVDCTRGRAAHNGDEFSAATLLRDDTVDALVLIGPPPTGDLPPLLASAVADLPSVVIAPRRSAWGQQAMVTLPVAQPGVAAAGTMSRLDRVALPLRALVPSPWPADHVLLGRLMQEMDRQGVNDE